MEEIEGRTEADKQWWEKRREAIKEEFMKELEEDSAKGSSTKAVSDDEAVHVELSSPAATPGGSKKKRKGKN